MSDDKARGVVVPLGLALVLPGVSLATRTWVYIVVAVVLLQAEDLILEHPQPAHRDAKSSRFGS